ncbi:MAG TPA: RNA polymerase sigma factor [Anaerolineae bacterium]|nr:RNA polymerase sigma factor [Anaerolineae bacterium]
MVRSQTLSMAAPPTPPLTEDTTDADLIRRAQQNLIHFDALYERYVTRVYRYCLVRVNDVQEAQDITSQTFLAALESFTSFRHQSSFSTWLIGIARHKIMDRYRQQRPQTAIDDVAHQLTTPDDHEETVHQNLQFDQIAQKLTALAPDRAEAIALRFFASLEISEIATIMKKNEPAVRMLVHRGLQDLQTLLPGKGETA